MPALNHAQIIEALEKAVHGPHQQFIYAFLAAYGTPQATIRLLSIGTRNIARIKGDVAVAQRLYFRAVLPGTSLRAAVDEIRETGQIGTGKKDIPFVLVTDYRTAIGYDCAADDQIAFDFTEFAEQYEFFLPLTGKYEKPVPHGENAADVKACVKIGRLYKSIRKTNHYGPDNLHDCNLFLARMIFCFFAEDTQLFSLANKDQNMVTNYVDANTREDGTDVADVLRRLFRVLDTPKEDAVRQKSTAAMRRFPYVNGALFSEEITIPTFNAKTRRLLLECGHMEWKNVNPSIFGTLMQSVMDPEERHDFGAHYTSEENIFKVLSPLFLDGLKEELRKILAAAPGRMKRQSLNAFHRKLGAINILDPACGAGNFLLIAFRELRRLEHQVLAALRKEDPQRFKRRLLDVSPLIRVRPDQFHGIEIQEFSVDIARVSMALMEHLMNKEMERDYGMSRPSIPLKHMANICCADALTTDWTRVVPADKLTYIIGNPPYLGCNNQTDEQKKNLQSVLVTENGEKIYHSGKVDFIAGWFYKAAAMMQRNTTIQAAFVTTNSICQGEQANDIWEPLVNNYDMQITFAYKPFVWNNEAPAKAHVHCIIIGFSQKNIKRQKIIYENNEFTYVHNINSFLMNNEFIFIHGRNKPICNVPQMYGGNQPIEGGHLIFSKDEMLDFIQKEPRSEKYFKKFAMGVDYLHNKFRYCLWFKNEKLDYLYTIPLIKERIEKVKEFRLQSTRAGTNDLAKTPHLFLNTNNPDKYIVLPVVSSEKRKYIPLDYLYNTVIPGNKLFIVSGTDYEFGVLSSLMHMTWMRAVAGRLKSDYSYSVSVVYNNFPWPDATPEQKKTVASLTEAVVMTRESHPERTLAQLYSDMPADLGEAHHALDLAVDALYRDAPFASDEERLAVLFERYGILTREEKNHA